MKAITLFTFLLLSAHAMAQLDIDSAISNALDVVAESAKLTEQDERTQDSVIAVDSLLRFDTTDYVFGEIKKGVKAKHVFKFHYTGTDTLIITDVTVDCGCTVPSLDKLEFAPGETGEIEVVYDSKDDIGRVLQYITVLHNLGEGYTFLTMSGFVLTSF